VITLRFDAASLGGVRLAPSPATEVVSWLRVLVSDQGHPLFGDPGPSARWALRHRDVALLAAVLRPGPTKYVPDLLSPKPPPGPWAGMLRRQLELIRETPTAEVVRQLLTGRYAAEPMPDGVRRAVESGTFARQAANGLYWFWRAALAEQWAPVDEAVAAEMDSQARTMATRGVGHVLSTLHPQIAWVGDQLRIDKSWEEHTDLRGRDLVLAPSVFGWPRLWVQVCAPGQEMLMFPVGRLPGGKRIRLPALAGALGPSRATILVGLDIPRTTTEISRRHGLAASTVSYHLSALFNAGMVLRTRHGSQVRYQRSEQGEALVRTNETDR